ncbi:putative conjugal transfer protein TraA [Prevotella intermedia]|uniref:Putative conjugal transfer protein TraA n=1 Tax=Prevotella intermedia TaxID=28131 RepID=A0A0S3UH26_PREIN|nr:putative conjugal transfer protein TraA [Prevotella intermedia]
MPAGTTLLWWIATIRNSASIPCVSVTHRGWIATPHCKNWQPLNSPSCKSPRTPSFVPRQRQPWIRSGNIWKRMSRIPISSFLTCPEPSTMMGC